MHKPKVRTMMVFRSNQGWGYVVYKRKKATTSNMHIPATQKDLKVTAGQTKWLVEQGYTASGPVPYHRENWD